MENSTHSGFIVRDVVVCHCNNMPTRKYGLFLHTRITTTAVQSEATVPYEATPIVLFKILQ